jgi:hypothetical protein
MEMIFENKIKESIQNFNNIDKPDYTESEINYYADFIELTALFVGQDGVTFGDIQDNFFGVNDDRNAEKRDSDEVFLNEVFGIIKERVYLYASDYPFDYTNNEILQVKSKLSFKNKLYLSLLISSKLNIFNKFTKDLTNDFEKISYNVLKEFLPVKAIVKEFGKNTQYQGTAIEKIKQLAIDLNLEIKDYELNCINERNPQDRGLDIVGWLPFADKCGNQVIFLCQCTCGKEYESKQHDTRRFKNYIDFYKSRPLHTLFIPYSLINTGKKKFYHSDLIEDDYLVFERKRILEYHNDNSFENSMSFKIVDKILQE